MLINFKDISSVRKEVEVEIPPDLVQTELQHVTTEFARQARIPGFRQGKVPTNVVRTRFQKEIQQEVMDRLLPRTFQEAIRDKGLQPVGNPALKSVDNLEQGKPIRYRAEFEVKPTIELHDYRGLEVTEIPIEVGEADVDQTVERLREQGSSFRPITDRPAQQNDYVVMDVVSSGEEVETRRSDGYQFHLSDDAPLPELADAVRGKSPGDQVSFEKTYGDDAPNEEVRGKTVHYDIAVKEVRELEKPEVNDQFAVSTGYGQNVEELRNRLREDLKRHKEHDALKTKRNQIGDKLLAAHQLDLPETLIEDEMGKALRDYARFLASQGIDLEKAEIDWAKIRDEFRPEAEKRVKRGLILEAIARKENLVPTDLEVDSEIRKAASGANREFAELRRRLREDGGYEDLRLSMMQDRALDLVLREAKVVPTTKVESSK